ncbi:hypothetical protein F5Y13DRAFT_191310 [Hypoxylon sp. FL1857]|nr:hypothetical protein F5Y13DRAFT_191310 [Hypoxylon sp. FL1857]
MGSNFARLVHETCRFPQGVSKTSNEKLELGVATIDNVDYKNNKSPPTQDEHGLEILENSGGRGDFLVANKVFRREDNGEATPEDERIAKESLKLLKSASVPKSNIQTDLTEDSVNDNESLYITAESHESMIFEFDKSDDNGTGQSTLRTCVDEDMPNRNSNMVGQKNVHWRNMAQDNSLFLGLTPNHGGWSEQTAYNEHDTDSETKNNIIDLDKVNVKPNSNISDTLRRVDAAFKHPPNLTDERDAPQYRCKTQEESINSIHLHVTSQETIYRWKPGSVITFNIDYSSFPNSPDSIYARRAASCLESAAKKWNKGNIGVRFEKVDDDQPAVFQLKYSTPNYRNPRLAESFFPGDFWHLQHLCVYALAFNKVKGHDDWLTNIFCHELGHILGLRHEFAGTKELDDPSVQLGEDNSSSIMNYFEDLSEMRIQESDYAEVREFYKSQGEYDRFKVVDVIPRYSKPLSRPLQFQLQRSTFNLGYPSRQSW